VKIYSIIFGTFHLILLSGFIKFVLNVFTSVNIFHEIIVQCRHIELYLRGMDASAIMKNLQAA